MLTPTAEIHLGAAQADQQRLMRRASNNSLSYLLRSPWRGIVEYVFPLHGLFRRGESLARVYDPQILEDLETARHLMSDADVSPLTIAMPLPRPRRETIELHEPEPPAGPADDAASPAPAPTAPDEAAVPAPPEPIRIDFDFEANQRQQQQLREQAELAGATVSAAIAQCRTTLDALTQAEEELAQRLALFEEGALAEEALRPAHDRVTEAKQAYDRAEAELIEAQDGYDRIAQRIRRLEQEAKAAHELLKQARAARSRLALERARGVQQPSESSASAEPSPSAEEQAQHAEPDSAAGEQSDEPRLYPLPREIKDLAAPRWQELPADASGIVAEVLAPEGTLVEAGDELLRVGNLQLAQLTARIRASDLREFRVGRSMSLTFEDYPEAVFEGWVASLKPVHQSDEVEVELLVACGSGPFARDPYLALRWMTLEAGVGEDKIASTALEPVMAPDPSAQIDLRLYEMFPTIGPREAWERRATEPTVPTRDRYTGRLQLRPVKRFAAEAETAQSSRLAALRQWRASYIDGMTTTILDDGTVLTYPSEGEINTAVRAMLQGRVSHRPNLCAATMREALGWGLGDAHQWAERLPRMGYQPRVDRLPRPGDILVWPFTYGATRSEHIGVAVRQGRKLMLLSNLGGRLGTSEILGGYIAFHHPAAESTS